MSDEKDELRRRRKNRRAQQDREKVGRQAALAKAVRLNSKVTDDKLKLSLRISKLIERGYSPESVAKRLGVTIARIKTALQAVPAGKSSEGRAG